MTARSDSSAGRGGPVWLLVPVLFGAYPVLSFYRENMDEVGYWEVLPWLAAGCAGAALVALLAWAVFRSTRASAVAASAVVFSFFSYGHLTSVLAPIVPKGGWHVAGLRVGEAKLAFAILGLLLVAIVLALARRRLPLPEGAIVAALVGGALLISSLVMVVAGLASTGSAASIGRGGSAPAKTEGEPLQEGLRDVPVSAGVAAQDRPDIYFIVLDRYMGREATREITGYDNGPFLKELEERGFFVADEAYSNYTLTYLSLASSLNMRYLDDRTDVEGKTSASVVTSQDRRAFYDLVRYNQFVRFLKRRGYSYVHIPSWWAVTQSAPLADRVVDAEATSELSSVFLGTTALKPFLARRETAGRRRRIEGLFTSLDRLRTQDEPVFVFAHVSVPHDPYYFRADGSDPHISEEDLHRDPSLHEKAYAPQVQYVNKLVLAALDGLTKERGRPCVVVLEGDHGGRMAARGGVPDSERQAIRRQHSALLAVYFSDGPPEGLHEGMSHVNTLRVVSDRYFGTDLGLLPDRSYNTGSVKRPYWPEDVTEEIRALGKP